MRAVKISAIRSGLHLITVADSPRGIKVVEGDPGLFARLGLEKYSDLDGVLRGFQHASEISAWEVEIPDWIFKSEFMPLGCDATEFIAPTKTPPHTVRTSFKNSVARLFLWFANILKKQG